MSNASTTHKNAVDLVAGVVLSTQVTDPIDSSSIGFWSDGTSVFVSTGGVASKIGAASTPQALSGAGAINVTSGTTFFTSTGAGNALTLANGTYAGQIKRVSHAVKGSSGTGVITPATPLNFATATLTAVRDWVEFVWNGTAWQVSAYGGATFT